MNKDCPEASIVYIDTNGSFRSTRLLQILTSREVKVRLISTSFFDWHLPLEKMKFLLLANCFISFKRVFRARNSCQKNVPLRFALKIRLINAKRANICYKNMLICT